MAKKTVTARAVPMLKLTTEDEIELRALGKQLQGELLTQYEAFLERPVDSQWQLLKTDGEMRAYGETSVDKTPRAHINASNSKNTAQKTMAQASKRPRTLITGSIVGTVEDAMFGANFHDTPTLQAFWATQTWSMKQSAVVATLEKASPADPFRFSGVTWCLQAPSLRAQRRHSRDFLSLVDIRSTTLSNGEPVGVVITHPIRHRDLPEMRRFDTVRGFASTLTVFRQLDARSVEVWSLQFVDVKRTSPVKFHQEDIQRGISHCASVCEVGLRKKLRWQLQQRCLPRVQNGSKEDERSTSSWNNPCELCSRPTSMLFSRIGARCQLCWKQICRRCNVPQVIVWAEPTSKRKSERCDVCIECVLYTKTLSAAAMARDDKSSWYSTLPFSVYGLRELKDTECRE